MQRILVCTDGSAFSHSSYHYAAWLAQRLPAAVDVLYVTDDRGKASVQVTNLSGSIGIDSAQTLLNKMVELEHDKAKLDHERAHLLLQDAKHLLKQYGADEVSLTHETGFLVDSIYKFEDQADLIILGKRGAAADFASDHLGSKTERIVRASHKPCLVTSRYFKPIDRLLLAYDGSDSCQKMLQFMVDSPVFKGLELHILTVIKKVDYETANARIETARQKANQGGFTPVCSVGEGDAEVAIGQYVEKNNIGLLLMGAYGHSRIRQLVIGSTTAQILRSVQIPVMLFR